MRFLFFFAVLLLAAAALFALQNPTPVTLKFALWSLTTTLALAIIGAAVLGGLVVYIASLFSLAGLRARLRGADARLGEWERERAARGDAPGQTPRP
jgi:uncharacterized integral membrane protein